MGSAILAEGLVKHYKEVKALDGLDLTVPESTVLCVLGPNGAGKTTAVRIFTTLLKPDAGRAEVAGIDVRSDPRAVRERIGLSGQYAAVDEYLTGFENLVKCKSALRLPPLATGATSADGERHEMGDRGLDLEERRLRAALLREGLHP